MADNAIVSASFSNYPPKIQFEVIINKKLFSILNIDCVTTD